MSLPRTLVALLLGSTLLVATPAAAGDPDFGRVLRGDGVLGAGCKPYRFGYRVHPGSRDWLLELFLRGPDGKGLGTAVKDSDVDRRRGRDRFRVCSSTTRPGRFRIRGKLTVYPPSDGNPLTEEESFVKWIEPARFRLRRPR